MLLKSTNQYVVTTTHLVPPLTWYSNGSHTIREVLVLISTLFMPLHADCVKILYLDFIKDSFKQPFVWQDVRHTCAGRDAW